MPKKSNLKEFKIKYLNKYPNSNLLLDKVVYINSSTKVICKCSVHGEFNITPNKLMSGQGCAECSGNVKVKDIVDFLNRNKNHKNIKKYFYDDSIYLGSGKKMKVKCKQHGSFLIKPNSLLNGQGCPSCAKNKPYKDVEDFLIRNKENNNINQYEIDKDSFLNSKSKLKLKCSIHGWFFMHTNNFLRGCKCKKCAKCYKPKDINDFLNTNKSNENIKKYGFEKSVYINSLQKIIVNCLVHGDFMIRPSCLLNGQGCSKCAKYGFNPLKPATLYVLNIKKKCGLEAIGYGISNNFTRRIVEHENNFRKNNIDWVLINTFHFENGVDCLSLENKIKTETKSLNLKIHGFMTEATHIDNLDIINNILNNFVKNKKI